MRGEIYNTLNVRRLCKCAENCVFGPNIFVVANKRVVFAIDCWLISLCVGAREG